MKQRKADDADAPSPERLAAYLDGELDPATRARVAAWICAHPSAAAEVQSLRRLDYAWRETTPPAPAQVRWDALLDRVASAAERCRPREAFEAAVTIVSSGPAAARASGWRWHLRMAGTAAALLFVTLWLCRPTGPQAVPPPVAQVTHVFRVAGDDDVDILSMDAADIGLLVVGEPPLRGPFILAAPGDVVLVNLAPDPEDGMMPLTGSMNTNNHDGPMILGAARFESLKLFISDGLRHPARPACPPGQIAEG